MFFVEIRKKTSSISLWKNNCTRKSQSTEILLNVSCFRFESVFCFVFFPKKKKSIDAVSNGWESSWGFQPLLQISALFLWLRAPPSLSPPDRHQHWSANHFSCNHPHNKLFKKPWNLTLLQISTAAVIALKRSPLPPSPYMLLLFHNSPVQITSLEIITTASPPFPPHPWKTSAFVQF